MSEDRAAPQTEPPSPGLFPGPVAVVLRDGTAVLIRPIGPQDMDRLRRGFERLSEESKTRRFLSPVPELTEEQLRYLTEIDGVSHFAWGALLADDPDQGIGVARYVRLEDQPDVAEAAVTIVDEYQRRGLGTVLLALLAARAFAVGVRSFRAYVQEENAPMRDLLVDLGARAHFDSPGLLSVDVPLDTGTMPDAAATRILRAVASRALSAMPKLPAS
jgi:RimJ/RimL family protein N-acetyltransferase